MNHLQSKTRLKRVLTPWTLSIYGIGSILGAGIYTMIGEVAGVAGEQMWIAFALAMVVALLTGLSYAELGGRYPKSGAESNFIYHAFKKEWAASLMGWMVLCASIISVATLSHAFLGYLRELWQNMPSWPILIGFPAILGAINFLGIQQSSRANIVATSIECFGLLIVLVAGILFFMEGGASSPAPEQAMPQIASVENILKGVAIAFFAFIGFEDIVNVADEVKKPERTLPIAILSAGSVAGLIYIAIAWISSQLVPSAQLAQSSAPLLSVVEASPLPMPSAVFTVIALFAVTNTALLNSITASRLVYGMSRQNLLPSQFRAVHAKRKTPFVAIAFVIPIAIGLALVGTLGSLAGTTSLILLAVFFFIHLSLIVIKTKHKALTHGFRVPLVIPILGAICTATVVVFVPRKSQFSAAIIMIVGLVSLAVYRKFRKQTQ